MLSAGGPPDAAVVPLLSPAANQEVWLPEQSSASDPWGLAAPSAKLPVQSKASAPSEGYRETASCLHFDLHGQLCSVCQPCPAENEWDLYELSGDPGRKNGAKQLWRAIKKSSAWQSVVRRQEAAHAAHAAGLPKVVAALVDGNAPSLKKEELLFLARHFGFRSYIWRRKGFVLMSDMPDHVGFFRGHSLPHTLQRHLDDTDARLVPDAPPPEMLQQQQQRPQQQLSRAQPSLQPLAPAHAAVTAGVDAAPFGPLRDEKPRGAPPASPNQNHSLFILAVHNSAVPRIVELSRAVVDCALAKSTRDVCFALGGDGLTWEHVAEQKRSLRFLEAEDAPAAAALRAANGVRFMRLKEADGPQNALISSFVEPPEPRITAEDVAFEERLVGVVERSKAVLAAAASDLAKREFNASALIDQAFLESSRLIPDVYGTMLQCLRTIRQFGQALPYLEVALILQQADAVFQGNLCQAVRFRIAWMEDVMRFKERLASDRERNDLQAVPEAPPASPASSKGFDYLRMSLEIMRGDAPAPKATEQAAAPALTATTAPAETFSRRPSTTTGQRATFSE